MQQSKSKKFITLCKKYGVDPDNVAEVLNFEDACKITKDNPKKLPIVTGIAKRHQKRQIADYKLSIIAEAMRGGGKADYNDAGEGKYFAVFRVKADKKRPSGFGLSCGYYDLWASGSAVGVRHCFLNSDQAIFFGKHFLALHIDHHLYT
jgi:hypothetical protein